MATMYQITRNDKETFDFQIEGSDEVYSVPLLSKLPISLLMRFKNFLKENEESFFSEKLDDDEDLTEEQYQIALELIELLSDIFEPYAPGVFGSLNFEQAMLLFQAYQEASNEGMSASPVGE